MASNRPAHDGSSIVFASVLIGVLVLVSVASFATFGAGNAPGRVPDPMGVSTADIPRAPPDSDVSPPVTSDDYDGLWHNADFVIALTAIDVGTSGVDDTYYSINGGAVMTVSTDGQPLMTTEGVNNTLEYWSEDLSHNEELPHNMLYGIKLDKTAPVAVAGEDLEVPELQAWMLDGLYSTDNIDIATYEWSIENGSQTDVLEGATAWYVFFYPGDYVVTLTVTDLAGNSDSAEMFVAVWDGTYPEIDIAPSMTVTAGDEAFFSAYNCSDNVGIESYYWDFGDGNESDQMNATHVFLVPGTYFVHLTVADAEGNEVLGSIRVIVLDEASGTGDIMLVAGVGIAVALVAGAMIAYVLLRRRKGSAGD